MYQNCCKKCGSFDLFIEPRGNNIGLYCASCGTWQQWMNKNDIRTFEHNNVTKKLNVKMRDATPEEQEGINKYVKSISFPTGVSFFDGEKYIVKSTGTTLSELSKEQLIYLIEQLDHSLSLISETCVSESKGHIESKDAIQTIRNHIYFLPCSSNPAKLSDYIDMKIGKISIEEYRKIIGLD